MASNDVAGEWPPALPANPIAEPDVANAEKINFNFDWIGDSNLSEQDISRGHFVINLMTEAMARQHFQAASDEQRELQWKDAAS